MEASGFFCGVVAWSVGVEIDLVLFTWLGEETDGLGDFGIDFYELEL